MSSPPRPSSENPSFPAIDGPAAIEIHQASEAGENIFAGEKTIAEESFVNAGFQDWKAAWRCYLRLASRADQQPAQGRIFPHLLMILSTAADPDRVLVDIERFAQTFVADTNLFDYLESQPRAIDILVSLFAGSQFLTEILLRNPELFSNLVDFKHLAQPKTTLQLNHEAATAISELRTPAEQLDSLRRYQRQEMLRIGACDLLSLLDLPVVLEQLSNLADVLVQAGLDIAGQLAGRIFDDFAVIGMGKLGGQELNYSSDIDLLFIVRSDSYGCRQLGEHLIETLARVTAEGFLYRVDMRLRPWGKDGTLVSSLDGYLSYLQRYARPWEKQALLKARFIAGSPLLGAEFLAKTRPLLFDASVEAIRHDVHSMKLRTESHLVQKGRTWGEVKLGAGSIRDVEFVVQFLQLAYGGHCPAILSPHSLQALDLLVENGFLQVHEQRVLKDGYSVFRTIEHSLQMMHYQQTNTLPTEPKELDFLARRLGFQGSEAKDLFLARYNQHCLAVRDVYLRYVGNEPMDNSQHPPISARSVDLSQHLKRMDPSYATAFSPDEIKYHTTLMERLADNNLVEVEATRLEGQDWQVAIVAYDYPGELSFICGLLYVYDLNIDSGLVFTYEPSNTMPLGGRNPDLRRKIVDVFRVRWVEGEPPADTWQNYENELENMLRLIQSGERGEARGALAKRVAVKMGETAGQATPLYPIEIAFDNTVSDRYTVLQIKSQDTIGFLYELTNALAMRQVYISQVRVESLGNRIFDTLFVTDSDERKIIDPAKQRELRAAIVLIKHFTHLLPLSANPESALLHFRDFTEKLLQQTDWPDEVTSFERPEVLRTLAQVLGISDFLWEDFLRMQYENLYPVVRDVEDLANFKTKDNMQFELEACLTTPCDQYADPIYGTGWRAAVNAFKDRELFRIDMRKIVGYTDAFDQFSGELTDLAEVIIEATYRLCEQEIAQEYGLPIQEDGQPCSLVICALGKCGGRELGFASDIELIFVYAGKGTTNGLKPISMAEFYEKTVALFLSAIRTRREGIFHIDLQLRPYGKAGSLAVSMAAFEKYFAPQGPAWAYERQALVRLRPISGDRSQGEQVLALRDAYVYQEGIFDVSVMRAMRQRQVRHMVVGGTFNAKYSPGGLLDVEYLVQGLQILHGKLYADVRNTNTRAVIAALAKHGLLEAEDYIRLRKAHTFLRWLIDSLRVVRGNAKDLTVPPFDSDEFEYLTRRLRYGKNMQQLQDELVRFTSDVQELNRKLLS